MKFGDYSPPRLPSPDQQRDALQKGLGRAWQWALNGRLGDEPLLEACLRDQRFDRQCEESRGDWLWKLVQTLGAAQRFRVPILHALYEFSDENSAHQLCELARCYAAMGDDAFRDRLYEIVEQRPFPESPWLGEEEIVALDGEPAFLFAARVRGQQLASREWEWDDRSLVDEAIDRFGERYIIDLLNASSDPALRRFQECWRQDQQKTTGKPSASPRLWVPASSVEEILRAAEGEHRCYWFRSWGMKAAEADLHAVLQGLWAAREPKVIANLLHAFFARALPVFDARLIDLCRHGDQEVRRRAFKALAPNVHPLVRGFALTELQKGIRDGAVAALFINNFRPGDEHLILEALETPDDLCELHWLLMDVIKVLEENSEADCSRLGVISYALTPCQNCRFYAARLLVGQQAAPDWLAEECRYDAEPDCRELFKDRSASE